MGLIDKLRGLGKTGRAGHDRSVNEALRDAGRDVSAAELERARKPEREKGVIGPEDMYVLLRKAGAGVEGLEEWHVQRLRDIFGEIKFKLGDFDYDWNSVLYRCSELKIEPQLKALGNRILEWGEAAKKRDMEIATPRKRVYGGRGGYSYPERVYQGCGGPTTSPSTNTGTKVTAEELLVLGRVLLVAGGVDRMILKNEYTDYDFDPKD